jgi:hypothetical protein
MEAYNVTEGFIVSGAILSAWLIKIKKDATGLRRKLN